jgi:Secretion system C-terminal sorting domain
LSQLAADDGSFLLNCYAYINNIQVLKIFKISPEGDIISETNLPMQAEDKVFFSPNPFVDELTLSSEVLNDNLMATIYDISGRLIGDFSLNNGKLYLGHLPLGSYVVHLMDQENKFLGSQVIVKVE